MGATIRLPQTAARGEPEALCAECIDAERTREDTQMFDPKEIELTQCPICQGILARRFDITSSFGEFAIDSCLSCGFAVVNPTPCEADIVDFYNRVGGHSDARELTVVGVEEAERRTPNSTIDAARITRAIAELLPGVQGRLLDVGCGFGFFSRAALHQGFTVDAIEIAKREREIATQILHQAPFASTLEAFEPPARYDAVILSQVLEHAREPAAWMAKVRAMMNEGGIVAVALPNFGAATTKVLGKRDPYVEPPAHLNYFSPGNLSLLLKNAGFRVERVQTISRLPRSTFEKRFGRALAPAVHLLGGTLLNALDVVRMGVMVNAYGRAI